MSIWKQKKVSGGGEDYPVAPAGSQVAVLVAIIDLGTQNEEYQGKAKKARKAFFVWELVNEKQPNGDPFFLGRDYSVVISQNSNLNKLIQGWRGKALADGEEFDVEKMIGKSCLLQLVHTQSRGEKPRTYARIDGVSAVPKGMAVGKPTVTPFLWDVEMGTPFPDYDWLPRVYGVEAAGVFALSDEAKGAGTAAGGNANEEEVGAGAESDAGEIPF